MTTSSVIEINDVHHGFGDLSVLEGVNLSIESGELVGLVGPNGAGKSTLLRIVSGAITPTAGTVALAGDSVGGLGSKATSRRVAVVPQSTTLSFSFPVQDIVAMGRHPYSNRFDRGTPNQEPVEQAMQRTDVAQFADRPIDELSGGERQRVILARAIAQETPGLLLDEPTNNLDINHQIETFETVTGLVGDGKGALAAIHDLELAARYCDRIALLADGRIEAVGPPSTVLTADRIESTFETAVAVRDDPLTGGIAVSAFPNQPQSAQRVHVLGAGAPAAKLVGELAGGGLSLSVGPVTRGDQVVEVAESVGAQVLTTDPYSSIDRSTRSTARAFLEDADSTLVAVDGYESGLDRILQEATETGPVVPVSVDAQIPVNSQLKTLADPVSFDALDEALARSETTPQSVSSEDS